MNKKLVGLLSVSALTMAMAIGVNAADFKVAYVARNQSDPFAAELVNQFVTQAEANYADKFTLDTYDSQADSEKENSIIEDCITKNYDVIIVQPNDGELQKPYCQKILDAGLQVVTVNAAIRELEGGSWVDGDPYAQGEAIASLAAEQVEEGASYVVLNCMPGNFHTESRMQAIRDIFISKREDAKLLADPFTVENATEAEAMRMMEDWATSFGRIDACITTADLLGNGAYEAVKDDPTYDGMLIYSVDCLAKTVLLIKDGEYTAAVYQNPPALAAASLDMASKLLDGEKELTTEVDGILCTAENVDRFIQMYIDQGQITEEEAAEHGYEAGSAASILED